MNIRRIQAADLPAIIAITSVAWGEMTLHKLLEDRHGMIGSKGWAERKVEDIKTFCEKNPAQVIVAEEDGGIVGYATFYMEKEDKVGYVSNNAVAPAFRGRGIGTAMNRWILDFFRKEGLRIARVATMSHDIAAQKVYEKQGFKELARTIQYSMEL